MLRLPIVCAFALAVVACGDGASRAPTQASASPTRTLLVTGFGPFLQVTENPSWEAIRELEGQTVGTLLVRTARLDVQYEDAPRQLQDAIDRVKPDLVLCLGVAPGTEFRLESTARNRDVVAAPDAAGVVRSGVAIREGGPLTLPSRLPLARLREALGAKGFEVRDSDDAGGYLCNHIFYEALLRRPDGIVGFVHVPTLSPPWDLPRLRRAVRHLIEALGA